MIHKIEPPNVTPWYVTAAWLAIQLPVLFAAYILMIGLIAEWNPLVIILVGIPLATIVSMSASIAATLICRTVISRAKGWILPPKQPELWRGTKR